MIYKVSHTVYRIDLELMHIYIPLLIVLHVSVLSSNWIAKISKTIALLDLQDSLKASTVFVRGQY